MKTNHPTFWFAAKRYGYGWGLPVRWQGWAVLGTYLALIYGGSLVFSPRDAGFLAYLVVLTALLIVIVVVKGEKPLRWRWK